MPRRWNAATRNWTIFADIASHDLKDPLRGLFNSAKFLQEDYGGRLAEDGVNRLRRLGYLSQHMEQLVNDLPYFSRLGRQELSIQPTTLDAVIRDIEVMSETTLKGAQRNDRHSAAVAADLV
jgi:two-component system, LuxR family, sensor kinase FixL